MFWPVPHPLQEELAATRVALDRAQATAQCSGAATPEVLSEREREIRWVGLAAVLALTCLLQAEISCEDPVCQGY
jgi:hypothetical protein